MANVDPADVPEAFLSAVPSPPAPPGDVTPPDASTRPALSIGARIVVTFDSGESWAVDVDQRDFRAYALNRSRYALPVDVDPARGGADALLMYAWAAWWAGRHRAGLTTLDWPAFNATAVDIVVEAVPAVPFDEEPTAISWQNSP